MVQSFRGLRGVLPASANPSLSNIYIYVYIYIYIIYLFNIIILFDVFRLQIRYKKIDI